MKNLVILTTFLSTLAMSPAAAVASEQEKFVGQANNFGAFIGAYGKWSAYIEAGGDEKKTATCRLIYNRNKDGKLIGEFEYGNEKDFKERLKRSNNTKFLEDGFEKTRKLLKQLCILKNVNYSIENAKPDLVFCARDQPNARIVLWDIPVVQKEGFLSVENKVVDGISFISGNGFNANYYRTTSRYEGDRYSDMYKSGSQEVYTQILIGYAKHQLWYGARNQCSRLIEVSACRNNYDKDGFDRELFDKIVTAANGLWSPQFCRRNGRSTN